MYSHLPDNTCNIQLYIPTFVRNTHIFEIFTYRCFTIGTMRSYSRDNTCDIQLDIHPFIRNRYIFEIFTYRCFNIGNISSNSGGFSTPVPDFRGHTVRLFSFQQ